MRRTCALILAVFVIGSFAPSPVRADEAIHLTPPLYRELARATQQTRSARDLTTTPQPIVSTTPIFGPRTVQVVAGAEGVTNR
ncbi:hypothetical protein OCOJLMKI_0364 [Methylobacterium iners]|uniref:Uncharacterized protein n=1 Tax=Methylobacterium iners TaxID=418707 RepID=A0ABQ4RR16_9HYPH|nr:hypothetical protein [Methylobacterium iners]GJD93174.1 hypothetical protein OCOJLMKI_0364 [Methylobacterium iners]